MAKILVVEDDDRIVKVVTDWLSREMHTVESVANGAEALERLRLHKFDAIILDLRLPHIDGMEVCKRFRENGGGTPILMLTGRTDLDSKEEGLDAGADDYLTKPFHPRELSARLRALLRRPPETLSQVLRLGNLELDPVGIKVTKCGQEITLMPKEFALLEFFLRHPGEVFSNESLLERVWHSESDSSPETVKVHINRLRNKIDDDATESMIRTVFRRGYKIEALPGPPSDP